MRYKGPRCEFQRRHARRSRSTRRPAGESRPAACRASSAISSPRWALARPSSSFLYRKMIPALAQQGLRAVAFDFPGLGLADRPEDFDYSWSGLSRWMGEAIDALGIDRCHLVVHDIGGPIACEWAVRNPERVLSLTALNTMLGVAGFKRPWSMQPFAIRGVGKLWLGALRPLP